MKTYSEEFKKGYKKGQEDAFDNKIDCLETLTICESINIIPELVEWIEKRAIEKYIKTKIK